ncbi:hypothetical protein [Aeromonas caviae]|uniref:hypothetical protein n=1 Tax=Aeromonas caviae TaxID=648 RepID=UPI001922B8A7|nr:hypothetical protein [Aeromonas caviae]
MNYQHQTAFFSQSSMLRGERGVMTGGVGIGVTIGLCLELAGTVAGFTTAGFGALTTAGRETTGGREMMIGRAITTAPCAKDDASRSEARSNFLRVRMLLLLLQELFFAIKRVGVRLKAFRICIGAVKRGCVAITFKTLTANRTNHETS